MDLEKESKAVDLSHHLSVVSRARKTSPLKGLQKYFVKPGMLSLAGGLPSPAYFPFSSISADVLVTESFAVVPDEQSSTFSWFWKLFGSGPSTKEKTTTVTIPKYPTNPGDINLAAALQYGAAVAQTPLQEFIKNFVTQVYQPAYDDFSVLIHTGNTDGWNRIVATLCNPGEGVLTEEWTYPSAMSAMAPYGINPVPIAMDSQGMRADSLNTLLSEWDEEARHMKRPHVMYIVPVGQNPKGTTMGVARKKEIYEICVKYDIIIAEDDPYYFLQMGLFVPKGERSMSAIASTSTQKDEVQEYIASLEPSFLRYDYEGRVIRLDTFSKTIAPGSRLGWFTCNPLFAERLERQGETSTQAPCGFGQSLITRALLHWKYEGYIRWLRGLGAEYEIRRNFFIDCLAEEFLLQKGVGTSGVWRGCNVYRASAKNKKQLMQEKYAVERDTMFSFIPPTAGMFVWMKLHLENHPSFAQEDGETLEMKLWTQVAEAGVLFGPGWMFAPDAFSTSVMEENEVGHFRISFSNSEFADLKKAVTIFGRVIREFFAKA
ncbi:hypothetical protein SERLA73DRAFT_172428 [Serpula lacrymans var. lacrymans S7.3]|uniref:Aminotransferase class I/classII large domain-containing protein n=1 Tax=Serpula lacrymans var. lacrymans (strain S7.3) TaxID=936435 RepID=F8QFB6_SERL3|nr:hypothetical protein SERLA73DRAFT_172428 [Serpula lacrymans var. lacrymans S7.3]